MHVGDSGHGVDLEVLVRTEGRSVLDRAPVGEAGLTIVEPLVGELTNAVGISPGDALGDLRARHTAAGLDHLAADLRVDLSGVLLAHEAVPHGVAATDNLGLSNVLTVVNGGSKADPVHLADEDLVTEEVAAPNAAVGVGKVVG